MKGYFKIAIVALAAIIVMTFAFTSAAASAASAQTNGGSPQTTQLQNAQNASGNNSEACAIREQRIALLIALYENRYQHNQDTYQRIKSIVVSALDNLSNKGYNVSRLRADLQTLNGYIQTFQQQKDAVINQLETAQGCPCGKSDGQFAQAMAEARQLAKEAHQTMVTIRTYYQTTIKPDFQALRKQIPAPTTTVEPTSTPTTLQ